MRVLVIGNCQAPGLAACLGLMRPDWEVAHASLGQVRQAVPTLNPGAWTYDRIYTQIMGVPWVEEHRDVLQAEVRLVPRIVFRGFHPDMAFVCVGDEHLTAATGPFHSRLALYGFVRRFGIDNTLDLFSKETFHELGYMDAWADAVDQLVAEGERVGLPLAASVASWQRRGCFMHAITQPRLFVLADVARALLARDGLEPAVADPEAFLHDAMKDDAGWGVYPEIAERLGVPGGYAFKGRGPGTADILDLRAFVEASFEVYRGVADQPLVSPGFEVGRIDAAVRAVRRASLAGSPPPRTHPYSDLPPAQRWRSAVAGVGDDGPDPATDAPFRLAPGERIATVGSCFAQHLAPALAARGFPRFEVEAAPPEAPSNYPARYGNVYTARQLRQLLERAFGRFEPTESAWQRDDGRFVDPFRPTVEPAGYASPDAVAAARETHLAAVRTLFRELDTLIVTLGLTEAWTSIADGAVFPLAPGVAGGRFDPERHRFVNFDVAAVIADLQAFVEDVTHVNPRARVILTVSPVPIAATYEPRHVLVSSSATKSTLRAAVDVLTRRLPEVGYFPAYEIAQELDGRGLAFGPDRRAVRASAVARVVDLFVRHWTTAETVARGTTLDPAFEVICDEDRL